VKALEAIAKSPNQKILMMPLDASSLIGSLAGIAEIAGDAFGKRGGGDNGGQLPPTRPTTRGGSNAGAGPWGTGSQGS
jgi:hypothetical protein